QGRTERRRRWSGTPLDRLRCWWTARWAARRSQGWPLRPPAGAGEDDPQREREDPFAGDPDDRRPGRAVLVEAGVRADLRGGLQAMFLWLPSEAPSPGRHR